MRIALVILLATGFLMANVYSDGKYVKHLLSYQKYYQMVAIGFGGFVLYWLVTKNPSGAHEMIKTSNEYLKYLPIDSQTAGMISPILDFTSRNSQTHQEARLVNSGGGVPGTKTKRSVSETKKKFVASRQNWKCGDCQEQLSAWFEVDHKLRLEYGGSNHIDNLVALCRECHGRKTTIENL